MKIYQKPEAEFISLIMQEEITANSTGADGDADVEPTTSGIQWN